MKGGGAKKSSQSMQKEIMLELGGGMSCYGQIVNLTQDNALIGTNAFSMTGRRPPSVGTTGIMSMTVSTHGKQEALKISCRVAYVNSGQIGLNILASGLTNYQQELLRQVTEGGSN